MVTPLDNDTVWPLVSVAVEPDDDTVTDATCPVTEPSDEVTVRPMTESAWDIAWELSMAVSVEFV